MKRIEFNNIHMGSLIKERSLECKIKIDRICNFFKCDQGDIELMYEKKFLDSEILLKWCKLLEYDFFRIYSQYLILYSPPSAIMLPKTKKLPDFRKNIYMKEMIDFILQLIENGEKTKQQVIIEYGIPKTTLYKWITKYQNNFQSQKS